MAGRGLTGIPGIGEQEVPDKKLRILGAVGLDFKDQTEDAACHVLIELLLWPAMRF